jgi:hypothetical protein
VVVICLASSGAEGNSIFPWRRPRGEAIGDDGRPRASRDNSILGSLMESEGGEHGTDHLTVAHMALRREAALIASRRDLGVSSLVARDALRRCRTG